MERRLPDFLVPGVQKGGTTTLQTLLAAHPQVFLPACKEVHYFSLHSDRGIGWYAEHFLGAQPAQCCGDITPYYLFHPEAPQRILAALPEAKLVVLLRDPVERTLSQYFHACRMGFETLPLGEALAAEPERLAEAERELVCPGGRHVSHQKHSYMSRSRYEEQLVRYEQLFPAQQLLVLKSEDLFQQPEQLWPMLLAFIGVAPRPMPALRPRSNAGRGESDQVPQEIRDRLRHQFAPTVAAIRRRYGISWGW